MIKQEETGRICCICHKRKSPTGKRSTTGFRTVLARNKIVGDKAHPECVQTILKKLEEAND